MTRAPHDRGLVQQRRTSEEDEEEAEALALYEDLLERAEQTDLTELAASEMVYRSGEDRNGRPSIVLVGHRIHKACCVPRHQNGRSPEAYNAAMKAASDIRDAVALLLLRETKEIMNAGTPFAIIFLATGLPHDAGPTFDFLRTLLVSLPLAVHSRLKAFHLVHPTLKMRFTFTLLGAALWGKIHFIDHLMDLHQHFAPGKLRIPEEVCLACRAQSAMKSRGGGWQPPQRRTPQRRLQQQQPTPPPQLPQPRTPPHVPAVTSSYNNTQRAEPTPERVTPPKPAFAFPPPPPPPVPQQAMVAPPTQASVAQPDDDDEEVIVLTRA